MWMVRRIYLFIIVIVKATRANLDMWLLCLSELRMARFQRAVMHRKGNSECSNITPAGRPMLRFCPLDPFGRF